MADKLPRVSGRWVYDGSGKEIALDTAAWFEWLESAHVRSFAYPVFDRRLGYIVGNLTVRKEQRQRGGSYWVVYRRVERQLRKVYLGRACRVTQQRLEAIAKQWVEALNEPS